MQLIKKVSCKRKPFFIKNVSIIWQQRPFHLNIEFQSFLDCINFDFDTKISSLNSKFWCQSRNCQSFKVEIISTLTFFDFNMCALSAIHCITPLSTIIGQYSKRLSTVIKSSTVSKNDIGTNVKLEKIFQSRTNFFFQKNEKC